MASDIQRFRYAQAQPQRDDKLTPDNKSDEPRIEAKLTRQIRAFRDIGLGTIIGLLSIVFTAITLTVLLNDKANQRGIIDGTVAQALKNTEANRADDKKLVEDDKKSLLDAIQGLRGDIVQALDIAKQTRVDVTAMRASSDQQMIELRQQAQANWAWSGKLESRIASIEAKIDRAR